MTSKQAEDKYKVENYRHRLKNLKILSNKKQQNVEIKHYDL